MSTIRVTKEFSFEMAHALSRYDGKCENVHGHTYYLSITVAGFPEESPGSVKCGMVMDFSDLKMLVQENILDPFDHALVLNNGDPRTGLLANVSTKIILTPYQPTCENLILDFVGRLSAFFSGSVWLHSLRLRETPTSYAEWFASDNIVVA
jgi:6-pyruvoyltetrahydropterin/6-carboxytetrahydropterin synthase